MSISIFLSKFLVPGTAVVVLWVGSFFVMKNMFWVVQDDVFILAETEDVSSSSDQSNQEELYADYVEVAKTSTNILNAGGVSDSSSSNNVVNDKKSKVRNYECEMDSKGAVDGVVDVSKDYSNTGTQKINCHIFKFATTSKKYSLMTEVKAPTSKNIQTNNVALDETKTTDLEKDKLKIKNNYFWIQMASDKFKEQTWTSNKKIKVKSLKNNGNVVFAELKPLLFSQNEMRWSTEAKTILVKASKITPSSQDTQKINLTKETYRCSFKKEEEFRCKIFESLIETKDNGASTFSYDGKKTETYEIEKEKYYLVDLQDKEYKVNDGWFYISDTERKTATFGNIIPVVLSGESENHHLFLMSNVIK